MGGAQHGQRDSVGGRSLTLRTARVVPNVPSFSVDAGFWYSVPEHLEVMVGSQVRVPLSGRRVRGWVMELGNGSTRQLREVSGVSGSMPVFDLAMTKSLVWASQHYVAPLAVVLAKASPPNLPRKKKPILPVQSTEPGASGHALDAVATKSAKGGRSPTTALVGRWQGLDWLEALGPVLGAGGSVVVVAATAAEVEDIHSVATVRFRETAIAVPPEGDAPITAAWEAAQAPGRLVIGTPRLATWMVAELTLAIVLEEGRRAMKDRQTPTIHVREMMRTRSLVEGFNLVFFGPTPSVELLAAGARVERTNQRPWGLVEVVDRSTESGGGLISDPVIAALRATLSVAGETAFILTGHKMAENITGDVNRRLGQGAAAVYPAAAPIAVGTERDLAGLEPVSLAVAADVDFMMSGTNYRSSEEAIRQLARLGNALRGGRGRRMMVQTRQPQSGLVQSLRRADPMPYLEQVLVERARAGVPPSVDMLAVEIRGSHPDGIEAEIQGLPGAEILGPVNIEGGRRWLLTGDLAKARVDLRPLVGRWRESGVTVRIDADPIDL